MAADEGRRSTTETTRPDDWDDPSAEELALEAADEASEDARDRAEDLEVSRFQALLQDRRKLVSGMLLVLLLVVAIYVLFPKIVGADEAVNKLDEATWYWVLIAIGFNVLAFAAYVALFRGVLGGTREDEVHRRLDLRASYLITMAGLAATRIFSAAGAGGIVLTYWALRKAGMPRRRAACRMVAFLILTYFVYAAALVIFGVLLRSGVLPGEAPLAGTVVPAAISGGLIALFLMIALIPQDFERRIEHYARGYRRARHLRRVATGPATLSTGVRTAIAYLRHPRQGLLAVGGAVGFWAANIGILWASFEAFGGDVPVGVLVQGFFVGMAANLIPSPAGGVGAVDAGMIGAFAIFGIDDSIVFPAVLTYRVIAFWLPIPPGIVAFLQLRGTVAVWDSERAGSAAAGRTTLQKVK
jgi:putative heme transporter